MTSKTNMLREIRELRKAFEIALEENNKLRAKREYWEMKFKKLEGAKN